MTSIQPSLASDPWADHIAAWRETKLTRAEYCRQRGLKLNEFLYRLSRHRSALTKTLTLVPVSVDVAPLPGSELLLRGPQGWSLSMSGDVSAAWLGQLLGTLS